MIFLSYLVLCLITVFKGFSMKLTEIQNGLSHAGRLRARNYEERSGIPKKRSQINCCQSLARENAQLRLALKAACRMLAADEFEKSSQNLIKR